MLALDRLRGRRQAARRRALGVGEQARAPRRGRRRAPAALELEQRGVRALGDDGEAQQLEGRGGRRAARHPLRLVVLPDGPDGLGPLERVVGRAAGRLGRRAVAAEGARRAAAPRRRGPRALLRARLVALAAPGGAQRLVLVGGGRARAAGAPPPAPASGGRPRRPAGAGRAR